MVGAMTGCVNYFFETVSFIGYGLRAGKALRAAPAGVARPYILDAYDADSKRQGRRRLRRRISF